MDTQLHLIDLPALAEPFDPRSNTAERPSDRAPVNPRSGRAPRPSDRHNGVRPRRPNPPEQIIRLSAAERAAGLRGIAEAREALQAAAPAWATEAEDRHHPSAA